MASSHLFASSDTDIALLTTVFAHLYLCNVCWGVVDSPRLKTLNQPNEANHGDPDEARQAARQAQVAPTALRGGFKTFPIPSAASERRLLAPMN